MNALKEWAMTLAGIVVLGSACEVILPDNTFRKYIRLTIGLVLLLTLASPLPKLLHHGIKTEIPKISRSAYKQRESMNAKQKNDVIQLYRINLNAKIKQIVSQQMEDIPLEIHCEIEEDDPDAFGSIRRIVILIDAEQEGNSTKVIEECLNQNFGVRKELINVQYLKE